MNNQKVKEKKFSKSILFSVVLTHMYGFTLKSCKDYLYIRPFRNVETSIPSFYTTLLQLPSVFGILYTPVFIPWILTQQTYTRFV